VAENSCSTNTAHPTDRIMIEGESEVVGEIEKIRER
jgi:hypothetical protein